MLGDEDFSEETMPVSEVDKIYSDIQNLAYEPFSLYDKETLRSLINNPVMRRALNYIIRGTHNTLALTADLNLLSEQQHLEIGLRAQGKVKGLVEAVTILLELAGFDKEPEELEKDNQDD